MNTLVRTLKRWASGSTPSLWTKAAAEFTGCVIFQFLGSVSPTPSTNAAALIVLVYYTAKLSGAHLNPALTTTFALLGYTNPLEVLIYWMAQLLGCIVGAMWVSAMVPGLALGEPVGGVYGNAAGCFAPLEGISNANAFGWEAIGTFCFILPIFSVVWYTQTKSGYGNTGPIIVGLSLYAAGSAVGKFTGGALNPARALASSIVFRCPAGSSVWIYVAGEFLGAILVPIAIIPWYGVSATIASSSHAEEDDRGSTEDEVAAAEALINGMHPSPPLANDESNHADDNTVVVELGVRRSPEEGRVGRGIQGKNTQDSSQRPAVRSSVTKTSSSANLDAAEGFKETVYTCTPVQNTRLLTGMKTAPFSRKPSAANLGGSVLSSVVVEDSPRSSEASPPVTLDEERRS